MLTERAKPPAVWCGILKKMHYRLKIWNRKGGKVKDESENGKENGDRKAQDACVDACGSHACRNACRLQ